MRWVAGAVMVAGFVVAVHGAGRTNAVQAVVGGAVFLAGAWLVLRFTP